MEPLIVRSVSGVQWVMGRLQQSHCVSPVLSAAAVFFCTGLSITSILILEARLAVTAGHWTAVMVLTSPLIFLCASGLVFFRPIFGYTLGAIGGLVALPWFVLTESSRFPSAWTYLNGPDEFEGPLARPFVMLKILSVALIAVAVTCSFLRLLPSRLWLRNSSLSRRTWPAIAVAVLVLALWFYHSARPWMLPTIVDAAPPELRILHVEKRGLRLHETNAFLYRYGMFWESQYDRRLLQYQFRSRSTSGVMPPMIREQANLLAHDAALRKLRTPPPVALQSWNAEGWYVALSGRDSRLLAFTTESGTSPPPEIKDLLDQIEGLPGAQQSFEIQDVCMGFCYDPVAGLGFWYSNQRCHGMSDGTTKCL